MPLTGSANAATDLAASDPAAFAAPIAAYAASDLFCYRDDRDAASQAEQAAAWDPLLAWAEGRHGLPFTRTQGVPPEIGRAWCRERVGQYVQTPVDCRSLKKKKTHTKP